MDCNITLKNFCTDYLEQVNGPWKGLNLTSLHNPEAIYVNQIQDAIYLSEYLNLHYCSNLFQWIDVGFGGGFPLLPLALLNPNSTILGLEKRKKKVLAVASIAKALNIDHLKVYAALIQEVYIDVKAVLIFKAVGPLADYLPLIYPQHLETTAIFLKGQGFLKQEMSGMAKIKNWDVSYSTYNVQGLEERFLVTCKPTKVSSKPKAAQKKLSVLVNGFNTIG